LPLKTLIKTVFGQKKLIDNMIWSIERTAQYEMAGSDPESFSLDPGNKPEKTLISV
jgi:hypothetical protein